MKTFQQAPPGAKRGELWARMKPVFSMTSQARELRAKARPKRPRQQGVPRKRIAQAGDAARASR